MEFWKSAKTCFGAFVFVIATFGGTVKGFAQTVFDNKGAIIGIADSCPAGNFGCVIRRLTPNKTWVRIGASSNGLYSVYDVALTGLYYSNTNCGGNLFFSPQNTLVPETAILNVTNVGTTYSGNLLYPSGAYNPAFSYASVAKGAVCVNSSGTAGGFPALTTKITFTTPLTFK